MADGHRRPPRLEYAQLRPSKILGAQSTLTLLVAAHVGEIVVGGDQNPPRRGEPAEGNAIGQHPADDDSLATFVGGKLANVETLPEDGFLTVSARRDTREDRDRVAEGFVQQEQSASVAQPAHHHPRSLES